MQTGQRIASLDDIRGLPLTASSGSGASGSSAGGASAGGAATDSGSAAGAPGSTGTGSTTSGDGTAGGSAAGQAGTGTAATGGAGASTASTPTSLGDVATVQIEESPRTSISRVDGKTALTIAITKTQEANTVDVSETVKDALPGIEAKVTGDPQFTVVFDQAPYIQQSIDSLAEEGLLGLGFAVLVILVFLLSWRSTLVTAISIPTSVLLAAIGMQAAGYTLNIITLAALTIAIGRVVDDSIVVIENIKRHLQPGVDRGRAVLDAVREVAGAVTASTLTTVAVFLPVAFVAELVGELFRPFALTVTMALLASLFVSLTIVPVLAYWWLRAPRTHRHAAVPTTGSTETVATDRRHRRRLCRGRPDRRRPGRWRRPPTCTTRARRTGCAAGTCPSSAGRSVVRRSCSCSPSSSSAAPRRPCPSSRRTTSATPGRTPSP